MLFAFLDTTALHKAYRLRGPQWESVQQAVRAGIARVATSSVTVRELERQIVPDASDVRKRLSAVASEAGRFGIYVDVPEMEIDPQEWRVTFEALLEHRGIQLVPHAEPSHDEMVSRDLRATPPFKVSGEGYRDTLIWLTFLEWVVSSGAGAGDDIIFVSDNTTQFSVDKGATLHPDLLQEVRAVSSAEPRLMAKRSDLVDELRDLMPAASTSEGGDDDERPIGLAVLVEERVRAAVMDLAGSAVDSSADTHLGGALVVSEVVDAAIEDVEIVDEQIEVTLVDTFDETTELWTASCRVILQIEGMLHKSDYVSAGDRVHVRDGDWNNHYMWVSFSVEAELRYDIRVEIGDASTYIELVEATPEDED